jgi:WD40 repeat protein
MTMARELTDADPRSGIVCVIDPRDRALGSGFLLTAEGLIATCAHVVALAGAAPGGWVEVAFLRGGGPGRARVEPEFWRDVEGEDVALLRWEGDLPEQVTPLPLRRAAGSAGNRFMTYGFPEALGRHGLWGYGTIGDLTVDAAGVEVLQLTATTETSPGFSGGPVIEQASNSVVGMVSSITPGDRYGRLTETAFATTSETLRRIFPALRVSDICPYRSLDFFAEEHARYFFGRERTIARLLANLRSRRFLAVLGPSGSGKSSLLRAGLSAQLRADAIPGSGGWDIRVLRPNDLLTPIGLDQPPAAPVVLLIDQFEETFGMGASNPRRVGETVGRLLRVPNGPIVVIAMRDDFYSHLAETFPDLMDDWVAPNLVNVPAVLTEAELTDIIAGPAEAVGLRLEDGLVDAVIDDVAASSSEADGWTAESVVAADDRLDDRGSTVRRARSSVLPLVEFALTRLWQEQDDGVLRRSAYRAMGGVGGAIARWADAVYFELAAPEREVARRMLIQLSQLGDDAAGTPASRRYRFLDDLVGVGDNAADVLGRLVTGRLLVTRRDDATGRVVVEIVHDALLAEWRLLREWLRADREFLVWRQELESRARAWTESHGTDDDGDWLRGRELDRALHWLQARRPDVPAALRTFVEESRGARDRQEAHERRIREEAEQARRDAEQQRQIADTRDLVARLRSDAEEAVALLETAPARGLALAIANTGRNLAELGGEPLAFVQLSLHATVRAAKERLVLEGHLSAVTALATVGRELVCSAGLDRTIRLWRLDSLAAAGSGQVIYDGEQHVTALAADPNAGLLAAGGADGTVRLWHASGVAGAVLRGHDDVVLALGFVPGADQVVSAGADGKVVVWDIATGEPVAYRAFEGYVSAVAVEPAPGGLILVTGHSGGDVRRWQAQAGEGWDVVHRHETFVSTLAATRSGIVSGGDDGIVRWTPTELRPTTPGSLTLGRHDGFVRAVCDAAGGTAIVSAGEDGTVRLWDTTGQPIHQPLVAGDHPITCLAMLGDGRQIAGGSHDGTVRIWDWLAAASASSADSPGPQLATRPHRPADDLARGQPPPMWDPNGDQAGPAWTGHTDGVMAVAFTHDGRRVVSASWDLELRIWDLTGQVESVVIDPHAGASLTSVACSPGGFPVIASGGRDGTVRLWDLAGRPLAAPITGHDGDVMSVTFNPDSSLIATGSRDLTVRLWRLDGTAVGAPMRGHTENIMSVAFSPDGQQIASGARDGTVRIWLLDGSPVGDPVTGHGPYTWAVAFSPAGASIAVAGDDHAVWVRQVAKADGGVGRAWRGHTTRVRAVAWSPVGRLLVSAADDGTIRLWDPSAGSVSRPLRGHRGPVVSLAISPDGRYAVTGGDDSTIRLWQLGRWQTWLREGYDRLRDHPVLAADADQGRAVKAAADHVEIGGPS